MPRRRPNWLLIGAAASAVVAALVYLSMYLSSGLRWLDVAADHGFIGLRRPSLVPIAQAIAHSVDPGPLVLAGILLVIVAVVRGRLRVAAAVPVILLGANATTQILKPALAFPRFSEWLGDGQITAASWPSGHSTAAMALALCAVLVAAPRWRPAVAALGAVFAVAIAYSLITLGWHWPSDVFGGFLVASTWTLGVCAALRFADARWPAGTGREAAVRLRDAVTPAAVAAGGAVLLVGGLAMVKPRPVLGYMAAHPAALTSALAIAALGAVLATGFALLLRR